MPEPRPSFIRKYLPLIVAISLMVAASSIIAIKTLYSSGPIPTDSSQLRGQSEVAPEDHISPVPPTKLPVSGSLAPDFILTNLASETVRLSDFIGSPIIINFWATWCGPCRIEMPLLQDRFAQLADQDLVVLAVNFDESKDLVEAFRDEFGITFEILLDPGARVQRLYRMRGYPASFFVDRSGLIQVHHIGLMNEDQINAGLVRIGIDV